MNTLSNRNALKKSLFGGQQNLGLQLLLFLAFSIILMVLDYRQHHMHYIRATLSFVVTPLQYAVDKPLHWISRGIYSIQSRHSLRRENNALKQQLFTLEFQLQRLQVLEKENERLKQLLDSAPSRGERALMAEILRVNANPFAQTLVLNKGARHDVYIGQPVLDAEGVVGQIVQVNPWTSQVLLLVDVTHALPVKNNRDGARAVAIGNGSAQTLSLRYVPSSADFQVGDLLITSGLGERFPAGYPVGIVTQVIIDPSEAFMQVTVKPIAQLDKVREVILVWPIDDEVLTETEEALLLSPVEQEQL